ncbi:MAG: transcriptional regulator [Chloracidobacterium sp.]|nr:transcriptional regulator [Chloracidobacterium sp.]
MDTVKHQEKTASYRFDAFVLDVPERRLWRGDEAVQLVPKQFDLLLFFVANAGRVTKKNEILDAVWPDTYVEETTLARNVSWLRKLIEDDGGKRLIETVPKMGYRFTPDVTISDESDLLVVEEQTVQYTRSEETITISDAVGENNAVATATRFFSPPRLIIVSLLLIAFAGSGYVIYTGKFIRGTSNPAAPGGSAARNNAAVPTRQSDSAPITIGSVVNLQNRYPNDGSYLDAWGEVWSKPEFRQVPTETKFVSTHLDPNRDNGSGSWEIVSASAKNKGEPLVNGDRIHLKNMHPNAGYLDACGWTEHLRVFDKFLDQTGAVFTTRSPDRDNGTGVWIIRSVTADVGSPIFEGDNIAIESSYFINDRGENRVSGFLNVAGKTTDIPAFSDYQGAKLVFTKNLSFDQPIPDIWTITTSKTFFE